MNKQQTKEPYEIFRIKIEDKEKFLLEHPDIKYFETVHPSGNITMWSKVYETGNVPNNILSSFGQYDNEGKFHFIDNDGWSHICYNPKLLAERRSRMSKFSKYI